MPYEFVIDLPALQGLPPTISGGPDEPYYVSSGSQEVTELVASDPDAVGVELVPITEDGIVVTADSVEIVEEAVGISAVWAIVGGADAALFELTPDPLNSALCILSFITPASAGVYYVNVGMTDSQGHQVVQAITVTVT